MIGKDKNAKLIGDLAPHNKWWGQVTRAWAQVYSTGGKSVSAVNIRKPFIQDSR